MSKLDKAIEQVLFENNIPNEWSSEINNELDQLKSETNSSRTDLTDKPFITIDGKDAKDFDDAVFCVFHNRQLRFNFFRLFKI